MKLEDLEKIDSTWRVFISNLRKEDLSKKSYTPEKIIDDFIKFWRKKTNTYEDKKGRIRCCSCEQQTG